MSKYIVAPPDYDEPDRVEGKEPDGRWGCALLVGMVAFWAAAIVGVICLFN